MRLSVKIFAGKVTEKELEVMEGSTYFDMLESIKVNPETVVVFNDGVPVPFDEKVRPGEIQVLRVVSGG